MSSNDDVTQGEARSEAVRLLREAESHIRDAPLYTDRKTAMAAVWARLACAPTPEPTTRRTLESRGHRSIPGFPECLDGMASLRSDD